MTWAVWCLVLNFGVFSTALEYLMCRGMNYFKRVEGPRLLLNETEHEIDMRWYRGSKEGFSIWQQALDPLYYHRPLEERFEVAMEVSHIGNGPEVLRLALAPGPLPSLVCSMIDSDGQTLLHALARCIGFWGPFSDSVVYLDQYEVDPTGMIPEQATKKW